MRILYSCLVYQELILTSGSSLFDLQLPSMKAMLDYLKSGSRPLGLQVDKYSKRPANANRH